MNKRQKKKNNNKLQQKQSQCLTRAQQRQLEEKERHQKDIELQKRKYELMIGHRFDDIFKNTKGGVWHEEHKTDIELINVFYNTHPFLHFKELDLDYLEYVDILLKKYGPVKEDYMIYSKNRNNCSRNPKLTYPSANLEIHHIDEDKVALLSNPKRGFYYPEYQRADRLVYANKFEHGILHYLIFKQGPNKSLGIGGIVNYGLFNDYAQQSEENRQTVLYIISCMFQIADYVNRMDILEYFINLYNCHFVAPGFTQNYINNLANNYHLHKIILDMCPIGITEVSGEEYYNNFFPTKWALKYDKVYIFRTKNNITASGIITKKGTISLFHNGAFSATPLKDINFLYQHLDEYYLTINQYQTILQQKLKPISDYIKANGGSGFIHGRIIDIDIINHIYFNPYENSLLGYTSTLEDWMNGRTLHLKEANKLLPPPAEGQLNLPATLSQQFNIVPIIPDHAIVQASKHYKDSELFDDDACQMYKDNRKQYRLQQSVAFHHVTEWEDIFNENYNWVDTDIDLIAPMIEMK